MSQVAAIAAVAVLAGLVCFQLLLVAALPLGEYAWGGGHRILPHGFRIASAVATFVYAAAAVILLEAAGIIDVIDSTELPRTAAWILAALFGIGVVMNAVSRSRKERVMAPVSLVLALLSAIVALGR